MIQINRLDQAVVLQWQNQASESGVGNVDIVDIVVSLTKQQDLFRCFRILQDEVTDRGLFYPSSEVQEVLFFASTHSGYLVFSSVMLFLFYSMLYRVSKFSYFSS